MTVRREVVWPQVGIPARAVSLMCDNSVGLGTIPAGSSGRFTRALTLHRVNSFSSSHGCSASTLSITQDITVARRPNHAAVLQQHFAVNPLRSDLHTQAMSKPSERTAS
jgi:hypothetical protein